MPTEANEDQPWERTVAAEEYRVGRVELQPGDRVVELTNDKGERVCGMVKDEAKDGQFLPCTAAGNFLGEEHGLCPAHQPGGRKKLSEYGKKGAKKSAKVRGKFVLPEWCNAQEASEALQKVTHALAADKIGRKKANVLRKMIKDSVGLDEVHLEQRIAELEETIEEIMEQRERERASL